MILLFTLFLPATLVSIWIRPYFTTQPHWSDFSAKELGKQRNLGRIAIVYFRDDWWHGFDQIQQNVLQSKQVERELQKLAIASFVANNATDKGDSRNELIRISGNDAIPAVIIYPASDLSPPIILKEQIDESAILNAISRAKRPQNAG